MINQLFLKKHPYRYPLSPRERRLGHGYHKVYDNFDPTITKMTKFNLLGVLIHENFRFLRAWYGCRYAYLEGTNKEEFGIYFKRLDKYVRFFYNLRIKGKGKKFNLIYRYIMRIDERHWNFLRGTMYMFGIDRPDDEINMELAEKVSVDLAYEISPLIALIGNKSKKYPTIESYYDYMFGDLWRKTEN